MQISLNLIALWYVTIETCLHIPCLQPSRVYSRRGGLRRGKVFGRLSSVWKLACLDRIGDQLEIVLTRVNNLAWMRIHSDNVETYLRCFAQESGEQGRGVNLAYLREMIGTISGIDENGGGPGVRRRKRPQK